MAKHILAVSTVIALTLAMAIACLADIPQLISFQGKLYDDAGDPLTGQLEVTFRIYDVETGGTELWSETINVNCENGLYNVILGLTTSIDLDFNGQYWMGVQVTGDDEMVPRYRMASVPAAYRAAVADSAQRVSWNNLTDVPDGFADGTDNVGGDAGGGWVDDGSAVRLETDTDNVGIGTAVPGARLEVEGSEDPLLVLDHTGTIGAPAMWFAQAGTTKAFIWWHRTDNYLNFGTPVTNPIMSLTDDGRVGIGTTNPGAGLVVAGDGIWNSAIGIIDLSSNPNVEWRMNVSGTTFGITKITGSTFTPFKISSESFSDALVLGTNGVGIGTASPDYMLHVDGDIAYTGNIYDISDIRLKENITPLEDAVEKVSSIRSIYFNNKGEPSGKREVGVIAQEVEKVLPEAVSKDAAGYKWVDYSKLTPLLIEAVKELKSENEELRKEIGEIKKLINK